MREIIRALLQPGNNISITFIVPVLAQLVACFHSRNFNLKRDNSFHFFLHKILWERFHRRRTLWLVAIHEPLENAIGCAFLCNHLRFAIDMHRLVIPGGHIDVVVPRG